MIPKIAVVMPCYKSKKHVLDLISRIGPEVFLIIAIDDACPMGTGTHIEQHCHDPRVKVIYNPINIGVGGAVMNGYRKALEHNAEIIVKIDSDGQMDPSALLTIVYPVAGRLADYTKGNRFFNIDDVRAMPPLRLIGNAGLSFLTKLSSGYWTIFDPTNGYTAIHHSALKMLNLSKIDNRFFFESDMLFRLYLAGAVVLDVPIPAKYADEESNLRIGRVLVPFFFKNIRNFFKRILYRYFLRDLNLGSLELISGTALLLFGLFVGVVNWIVSAKAGVSASAGTVMLAGLPILAGLQLVLGFLAFDVMAVPRVPLQLILPSQMRTLDGQNGEHDTIVQPGAR